MFQLALQSAALPCQLQVGAYSCFQLAGGERLDKIVVSARVQSFNRRFLTRTRRQQDDGQLSGALIGTQRLKQPKAIQPRHHHIGEHQIGRCAEGSFKCRTAVGDGQHLVGATEESRHVVPHVGVIVSPKNARSRTSRRGRRLGCFGFKKVRLSRAGTGLCRQPMQGLLDVCRRSPATGDVAIRRADLVCG